MIYPKETVLAINIVRQEGNRNNLEFVIDIVSYNLIQCQKWKKVSLVLGLMFSKNSLWKKVVPLLGGAKVKLLKFLMKKNMKMSNERTHWYKQGESYVMQ